MKELGERNICFLYFKGKSDICQYKYNQIKFESEDQNINLYFLKIKNKIDMKKI
jgi:hypothetical protein